MYCSRSCSASVNNTGVNRHKTVTKFCSNCGVKLNTRRLYCSNDCKRKQLIQYWLEGKWNANTKNGVASVIRDYLFDKAEFKCQDGRSGCGNWGGFNPKSGRSCLQIEHIDGNPMNHRPENLSVICPNCHSMTETYGALNKGFGRSERHKKKVVVAQSEEHRIANSEAAGS